MKTPNKALFGDKAPTGSVTWKLYADDAPDRTIGLATLLSDVEQAALRALDDDDHCPECGQLLTHTLRKRNK